MFVTIEHELRQPFVHELILEQCMQCWYFI